MPDGTAGGIDWQRVKRDAAQSTPIARDPATDPYNLNHSTAVTACGG